MSFSTPDATGIDINAHDHFVLRQRIRLVINQYEFSIPDPSGDGRTICFVEQKRFKFKEDIRFFTDDSKSTEVLRILARQRFDPRARYDITLADGSKLGEIQKVFGASLLRSTYTLFDATGQQVAVAREKSMATALLRRLVGLVPYIGGYADWLPIAYDFEFLHDDQQIGINRRRRWKWRDIYDIDFSTDTEHVIDRRLVLAATVGMDALQAR
ncbi:MAG: hypothetical protein ACR2NA_05365 [Solirubrobacterales bacterium]